LGEKNRPFAMERGDFAPIFYHLALTDARNELLDHLTQRLGLVSKLARGIKKLR
jgi:hypothetical protein